MFFAIHLNGFYLDIITAYRYNLLKGGDIMQLNARMARQNLSIYRLAKTSGVPYATLNDICNGKAQQEQLERRQRLVHRF